MTGTVAPYDLTRPPLLKPDQRCRLGGLASRLAGALSSLGSEYLGCEFALSFRQAEECVQRSPRDGGAVVWAFPQGALQSRPPVWSIGESAAHALVVQMICRQTGPIAPSRPLTGIERALVAHWCRELQAGWAAVWPGTWRDTGPRWVCIPDNMQSLDTTQDRWLRLCFDLRMPGGAGEMGVYVTYSEALSALPAVEPPAPHSEASLSPLLSQTQVTACVKLGTWQASLIDLVNLRPGDVVSLGVPAEAPLMLGIEGVEKLPVRPGIRNGRIAVQVMDRENAAEAQDAFVPVQHGG